MKRYYTASSLLLITLFVFGQAPPPATPIDGGLGLLLAGGAVYGMKKLKDLRRNH